MALIVRAKSRMAREALAALLLLVVAGCAAGPAARPDRGDGRPAEPSLAAPESRERPAAAASPSRKAPAALAKAARAEPPPSFPRASEALRDEIDEKAEALRTGPIGNRAQQLASLRLAATGRELLVAGSLGGALEALQKAVSLYGANGYAYLFLASVHQAEGRRDQAREFAASARRYLPRDEGVQAELEGLDRSIGGAG